MMKFSKKYIVLLILFPFVISCGKDNKSENISKPSDTKLKLEEDVIIVSKTQFLSENMSLDSLQSHKFPEYIRTTGTIDVPPNNKAIISAYVGGYIKNSPLLIGDKVKKGQALLTIENLDFVEMQQEYMEILEQLTFLKTEYERQKELFAEKISSKKSFQKSESDYKKTKAIYNGLRKKLQMLNINISSVEKGNFSSVSTIYSPINGSITNVNVTTGVYVSPADNIMEIVNMDHIHLELKVFEKDFLKIKKEQKVVFKIPESSDEFYDAEIHLIGKSISEDRTIPLHAHLEDDMNHNFIVGMFVEADIFVTNNFSKSLKEEALIEVNNEIYVLVLKSVNEENYIFTKKVIKVGKTFNGYTEILNSSLLNPKGMYLIGGYNLISEEE